MLHSINYIKYFINKKNKENYLKNGGGFMAYVQYEKKLEKQKDVQKIQDLINELNTNETFDNDAKTNETFDSDSFLRIVLEQELENSLNNLEILNAEKIEKKINELKNKQKLLNVKNILRNFKNKSKEELKNFILNTQDLQSQIGEEWLSSLTNWANSDWRNFKTCNWQWAVGCFVCFSVFISNKRKQQKRKEICVYYWRAFKKCGNY